MAIAANAGATVNADLPWGILTGVRPAKIVHRLLDHGEAPDSIQRYLQSRYGVSVGKASLLTEVAVNNRRFVPTPAVHEQENRIVSMYLGIPYCASRCVYCSFPSALLPADEGQIVPSQERLCLGELMADLVEFHRLVAEEKGVVLTHEGDGAMRGDPLMVRRAVGNLLSNAIRHTPPGGRVTASILHEDSGSVVIAIANTGETVPAEHLPRLFDRFYRVDPSRTGEGSQSGLGLAIVKSIVEAHGGRVSVGSADGVTSFRLLFNACA